MRIAVSVLLAGVLALRLRCSVISATCEKSNVPVRVLVVAGDKQHFLHSSKLLSFGYGGEITIFCTGSDSKNLQLSHHTETLGDTIESTQDTDIVNMTTRKLIMENPAINIYVITCTDVVTTCAVSFKVNVGPLVTVVSPSVHLITDTGSFRQYSVPAGEEYEIVCSGTAPLSLFPNDVETISVNKTMIKAIKLNKSDKYECSHQTQGNAVSVATIFEVIINNDYLPVLRNFWCIEMDSQINCTWQVLGTEATSTLLYNDKYGNSMLLDAYKLTSSDNYYGIWRCGWSPENVKQHGLKYHNDINLLLQACRLSSCVNQTHHIDRTSIMISASPVGIEILETETTTRITWNYNEGYAVEYNITCRLPGLEWAQELKAASQENCDGRNCKIDIKLPCPRVLYELKMYAKSKNAPQETMYWSDPATKIFRGSLLTGSQENTDAVDPMCNKEPEPIVKYVGAQKVKELRRSFNIIENNKLSGKIKSMKRKLDLIKKLCHEQSLGDCEHRNDYVL